ncbi:MAG TPA: rRNA maturation RNase YbeY [Terriglobales bacterium]|jgi:probable rRNA maturation factor
MVVLRKTVAGLSEAGLARFVAKSGRACGLRGSVNVLVSGSRELRSLNYRFRGRDKPTDVLSFPPMAGLAGRLAGDIAISAEMAADSARQLGHSTADEVKILVLHGLLHLAGYDHETDNGEMGQKETQLRRLLGLPVGLIEREPKKSLNRRGRGDRPRSSQRKPPAGDFVSSSTTFARSR